MMTISQLGVSVALELEQRLSEYIVNELRSSR